jgi:hypothetical protein
MRRMKMSKYIEAITIEYANCSDDARQLVEDEVRMMSYHDELVFNWIERG